MLEKIKVSVPKSIEELLRKDARDFRITKASGEENLNAFINALVVHFYESFAADEERIREGIKKALSAVPEIYAQKAFEELVRVFASGEREKQEGEKSVALSFKPTKSSESVFIYIENVLLQNESLSSFYRRMFISYAQKTKNEREKIIHKENYELLCRAIKKGCAVCISLENGYVYNGVSLHSVTAAKDEMFNYVLAFSEKKNRTLRLAKIKTVSLLAQKSYIPDESRERLERQAACAAQYPIYPSDDQPIKVRLTEKGKEMFERIYLYRPTPVRIEGDDYIFHCSASQVIYYFERFGAEALVLSPKKIGKFMRNYYYYALKKYRTVYKDD